MTPLSVAFLATAFVCLVVGLQHTLMAVRVKDRRLQLLFAGASFCVGFGAILEGRILKSSTADQFLAGMPWTGLFTVGAMVALSWYIEVRTGSPRRWPLWVVSALATLYVLADFSVGATYRGPVTLSASRLPWGEEISRVVGEPSPLRIFGDLLMVCFLLILVAATVRMIRAGNSRQAWLLGGSLVLFGLAIFSIIPADLGWFHLPSPHIFAFLLMVAAMSWDLAEDLVRASQLAREVVANERRWRQLLEEVHLLVAVIDRQGRVTEINPYFVHVLGFESDDVAGRYFWDFVAPDRRDERQKAFERAMSGDPTPEVEVDAMGRSGDRKHIVWRNVLLRDREGLIEGMLSLGADVTERWDSALERDRALADLERAVGELKKVRGRLEEENFQLREEVGERSGHDEIVGESDAMLYVLHKIDQVADKDVTVLIQGETGVGKELVARAVHRSSPRAGRPFVALNCATVPRDLAESELFGHEKGAFTGADRRRLGRFELANGGTLFLDEVGELPLDVQPKLLRVLQDGEFERVGGQDVVRADVRLLTATNRDLRAEVEAGRFREDLYYRLDVYPITVPPLRDRSGDVERLVNFFAAHFGDVHGTQVAEMPAELMRVLGAYQWPGNVRELQNVIERAVLASRNGVLRLSEPFDLVLQQSADTREPEVDGRFDTLEEVERRHIEAVLEACNGQISGRAGAAQVLGLHPNTLRSRIKKLGLVISKNRQ